MQRLAIIALLALAACGKQHSPQDQAVRDAHDVAVVEQVNRNAITPIEPQPILYPDIETNQLHGTGCAFAAGDGLGSVMLTRVHFAYMKLADKVVRFSVDMGSPELPAGAHTGYRGNDLTLTFAVQTGFGKKTGAQVTYPGSLTARDADGNLVYQQQGSVQCDS